MGYRDIHPPTGDVTEADHRRGYYKYILETLVDGHLLGLHMDRENPERQAQNTASFLHMLFSPVAEGLDSWESVMTYEKFKADWGWALNESHDGDCTSAPGPCIRCHAEDLYEIPSSVTWANKAEGAELFKEYCLSTKENGDA